MVVAGVDGCRGRWLIVRRSLAQPDEAWAELVDDLGPLIDQCRRSEVAAVAIDMPIGLLEHHPRACDVEARRLLGPRRSSVFPAPVRAVLGAGDYDEARRRSRAAAGVAPSRQAFNLVPAITQLDDLIEADDQDQVVEAHPELAFARLAGEPLTEAKRTPRGRAWRRQLLTDAHDELGSFLTSFLASGSISSGRSASGQPGGPLPEIDLLDATALTVTAAHVVAGTERRLGQERDHRGRRAEVTW